MKRRDAIKSLGAGAVGALTLAKSSGLARASDKLADPTARTQAAKGPSPKPSALALLSPLQLGDEVSGGWALQAASPASRGGCAIDLLGPDGQQARVHVCALGSPTRGIASTNRTELFLVTLDKDMTRTDERIAQVIQKLGRLIDDNEGRTAASAVLADLQTYDERVARYGPEVLL